MVVVAFFAVLALSGCRDAVGPKAALDTFLDIVEVCDSDRLKAACTKESVSVIERMTVQLKAFMPPEKARDFDFLCDHFCKGFKREMVTFQREEINGDMAVIVALIHGNEEKIPLKREDGAWKIDLLGFMQSAKPGAVGE